jgi:hypothetical protein
VIIAIGHQEWVKPQCHTTAHSSRRAHIRKTQVSEWRSEGVSEWEGLGEWDVDQVVLLIVAGGSVTYATILENSLAICKIFNT